MRLPLFIAGLLACMISHVAATALTYKLTANEKACFYAMSRREGEKMAFYFAVRNDSGLLGAECAGLHRS